METGYSVAFLDRARRLLVEPRLEWSRIDGEPATIESLFKKWVVVLAAIPPVAGALGILLFGERAYGIVTRPSIAEALVAAVTQYLLSVGGVFVLSLVIDSLAPSFGGSKSSIQSTKVAAYSMTAAWVAGITALIPQVAWLGVLAGAGYSIYLLSLGLPLLMKVAADKAAAYTVAVAVAGIVLWLVILAVAATIVSSFAPQLPLGPEGILPSQ
jgi:hypothetical protein